MEQNSDHSRKDNMRIRTLKVLEIEPHRTGIKRSAKSLLFSIADDEELIADIVICDGRVIKNKYGEIYKEG